VPAALTEAITLGRTLKKRAVDVLAYFDQPGTSSGPTEAINDAGHFIRGDDEKGRWWSRRSGRRQADAAPESVGVQRGHVAPALGEESAWRGVSVEVSVWGQRGVCWRASSRVVPLGTPRPVQGSQPGAAVHLPLFPVVMSRKPGGTWPGVAAA